MTTQTDFTNWQRSQLDWDADPYEDASPNLLRLLEFLLDTQGGMSLGIHADRNIRNGGTPSSHAYGAALDWRWAWPGQPGRWISRAQLEADVLPFLIGYSDELGIQAIHDQGRIWRSYRANNAEGGWKLYRTGYGAWLHIETTQTDWNQSLPILDRNVGQAPTVQLPDASTWLRFDPLEGDFGLWPLHQPAFGNPWPPRLDVTMPRASGDHVRYLQGVILHHAGGRITVDGYYGPKSKQRVVDLQKFCGLTVDGIVGPQTWGLVHYIAGAATSEAEQAAA